MDPFRQTQPATEQIGPYRLLRLLGKGSFGAVYEVERPGLPGSLALKLLTGAADPEALARFEREARLAMQPIHPAIVRVVDVGAAGGRQYYVMEHVPGPTLQARLREGPLLLRESAALVRDLAEAVAAAHERGIVHRDLKPGNVILGPSGPRLLDFGLAREALSALTASQTSLGTPLYMAPEQATDAREVDARADVYGLGAILHHCLTGEAPNRGATPVAVLLELRREAPVPPLRAIRPEIPVELEEVCLRALARNRAARTPTARELQRQLEAWLAPPPPPPSPALWRPTRPVLVAVALVLLGAGLGAGVMAAREATVQPAPDPAVAAATPAQPLPPTLPPAAAAPRPAEAEQPGEAPATEEETPAAPPAQPTPAQAPFLQRARDTLRADPVGALKEIEAALERGPPSATTWTLQAEAHLKHGQRRREIGDAAGAQAAFRRSLDCFEQARRIEPRHAGLIGMMGYLHWCLGEFPRAIEVYTQALELDPKLANVIANRGYSRMELGDLRGALADFQRARQVDPGLYQSYLYESEALGRARDRPGAIRALQAALQHARLTPAERAGMQDRLRRLERGR